MSSSSVALDFKAQGNAAYKLEKWTEAIGFYSKSIKSSTRPATERSERISLPLNNAEALGALLSNRCAAYCKLFDFGRAMLDARACIRILPKWSKSYSRRAEVHSLLQEYKESAWFYGQAYSFAENDNLKSQLRSAITTVQALDAKDGDRSFAESGAAMDVNDGPRARCVDLVNRGLMNLDSPESALTSAGNYCKLYDECEAAFENLAQCAATGQPCIAINDIARIIVCDRRAYISYTHQQQALDYVLVALPKSMDFDRFLDPTRNATKVIKHFVNVLEENGNDWNTLETGTCIQLLISTIIIQSFWKEVGKDRDWAAGCHGYKYAIALIDAARLQWPKRIQDNFFFTLPFLHGLIGHLSGSIIMVMMASVFKDPTFNFDLQQKYADRLIKSCLENPLDSNDPGYLSHHAIPLATAYIGLATLHHEAAVKERFYKKRCLYSDPKDSALSAKYWKLCIDIAPADDSQQANNMYAQMAEDLRAGGNATVTSVFDTVAEAERTYRVVEAWAGPQNRLIVNRETCLSVMFNLIEWLEDDPIHKSKTIPYWSQSIKAVPVVTGVTKKDRGVDYSDTLIDSYYTLKQKGEIFIMQTS